MHPNIAPKKGPNNEIHIPNTNNIKAILGENKNSNKPKTNQIIFISSLSTYTSRTMRRLQRLL